MIALNSMMYSEVSPLGEGASGDGTFVTYSPPYAPLERRSQTTPHLLEEIAQKPPHKLTLHGEPSSPRQCEKSLVQRPTGQIRRSLADIGSSRPRRILLYVCCRRCCTCEQPIQTEKLVTSASIVPSPHVADIGRDGPAGAWESRPPHQLAPHTRSRVRRQRSKRRSLLALSSLMPLGTHGPSPPPTHDFFLAWSGACAHVHGVRRFTVVPSFRIPTCAMSGKGGARVASGQQAAHEPRGEQPWGGARAPHERPREFPPHRSQMSWAPPFRPLAVPWDLERHGLQRYGGPSQTRCPRILFPSKSVSSIISTWFQDWGASGVLLCELGPAAGEGSHRKVSEVRRPGLGIGTMCLCVWGQLYTGCRWSGGALVGDPDFGQPMFRRITSAQDSERLTRRCSAVDCEEVADAQGIQAVGSGPRASASSNSVPGNWVLVEL